MKYINLYSTLNDYITDFCKLKDYPVFVNYIKDNDKMMGLSEEQPLITYKPKSAEAWFGDILCWNTDTNDWYIYYVHNNRNDKDSDGNFDPTEIKTKIDFGSNLIPDSVCVVPACYTNDNKARWCALYDCSYISNDEIIEIERGEERLYETGISYLIPGYDVNLAEKKNPSELELSDNYYNNIKNIIPFITTLYAIKQSYFYENGLQYEIIFDEFGYGSTDPNGYYNEGCLYNENTKYTHLYGECLYYSVDNRYIYPIEYNMPIIWAENSPILSRNANDYYYKDIPISTYNILVEGLTSYIFDNPINTTTTYQQKKQCIFSPVSDKNAFSDMNGYENTLLMLNSLKDTPYDKLFLAAYYASHPSENLTDTSRYTFDNNPDHNPEGTWYIPSIGEIVYLLTRMYSIQYSLSRIEDAEGFKMADSYNSNTVIIDGIQFSDSSNVNLDCGYWTSTWTSENCLGWYVPVAYYIAGFDGTKYSSGNSDDTNTRTTDPTNNLAYKKRVRAFKKY